jgi:DNA polymerase III sliding clamp (beta) subunit (PCNA family)
MEESIMLKFTMNNKDLKSMIEKGVAAINKKTSISTLTRLYFQVDDNGVVKILGTDHEHYVEIRNDSAWDTNPGVFGIDVNDLKIITTMNGNITLEDISTEKENKINVKAGKKCITIPRYENTDIFLPSMDETEECFLIVRESWLLDTTVNLLTYTSSNENNKMMQVFNFNTSQRRVEALDGNRIGMRTLNEIF